MTDETNPPTPATAAAAAPTKDKAAAKKTALWKKQVKNFKLKDAGKKIDAIRFCAQDEQFLREPDVLPLLLGFLPRVKVRFFRERKSLLSTHAIRVVLCVC